MGSCKFSVRSSSGLTAYRSNNGSYYTTQYISGTTLPPALTTPTGTSGVFGGGQLIDVSASTSVRGLWYPGLKNVGPNTTGLSVLVRLVPKWTGLPPANCMIFSLGAIGPNNLSMMEVTTDPTGKLVISAWNNRGQQILGQYVSATVLSFTNGTATDILMSWDGTDKNSGSGNLAINFSQDGVSIGSVNNFASLSVGGGFWDHNQIQSIMLGCSQSSARSNLYINECNVYDYALSPTYSVRTDYDQSVTAFDAFQTDAILATDLKHGVSKIVSGISVAGTYRGYDLWTAVPASMIYLGASYLQDGATVVGLLDEPDPSVVKLGASYYEGQRTGTYDGSDRWSDPGATNVSAGVVYNANGVNQTGTRNTVTNVLSNVNLTGQGMLGGTLTAG